MFTKGYQDKRGCRAGSPLGLRGESRNCSSTQGEVAGPAPGFGPAYGPGPSRAGEGSGAERPRAAGAPVKEEKLGGFAGARAGGRWCKRTRRPAGNGAAGSSAADARPRGFPALRSSPGQAAAQKPQSGSDPKLRVGEIKLRKDKPCFKSDLKD